MSAYGIFDCKSSLETTRQNFKLKESQYTFLLKLNTFCVSYCTEAWSLIVFIVKLLIHYTLKKVFHDAIEELYLKRLKNFFKSFLNYKNKNV